MDHHSMDLHSADLHSADLHNSGRQVGGRQVALLPAPESFDARGDLSLRSHLVIEAVAGVSAAD